ncbi:DUF1127 domain-containing protein [Pseudomonas sp. RIT-PI-S]|uniref:DUF1127 domain-containing protein n=1 Tax=Pseudomonas sp. RIT-PI-S TaxID=3035295 RepID=UPI0021DABDB1|nr:DUF1127 domain-containing protein [Pseudomonas sp. RIT-PI-S]
MNGFTDVRLFLKPQDLNMHGVDVTAPAKAPPSGLSHWALLRHRWATRRQLLELDADQLADIGLTPQQQREEGLKPFWRV